MQLLRMSHMLDRHILLQHLGLLILVINVIDLTKEVGIANRLMILRFMKNLLMEPQLETREVKYFVKGKFFVKGGCWKKKKLRQLLRKQERLFICIALEQSKETQKRSMSNNKWDWQFFSRETLEIVRFLKWFIIDKSLPLFVITLRTTTECVPSTWIHLLMLCTGYLT